MTKYVNLTPHKLVIYDKGGENIKYEIEPSGTVARVKVEQEYCGMAGDVEVYKTRYGAVEGLPKPKPATYYIVSNIVLQALKGVRKDIVAPDTSNAIRDENGRIIGIKQFIVV